MSMAAPARAGDLTIRQIGVWGGSVQGIEVEEVGDQRIAYIGNGMRLLVLDVTDPPNIIELGSVWLEGVIMDVKVRDGYAYIGATPPAYFSVVDVHNPAAPLLVASRVGQDGLGGLFVSVELDGNRPIAWVTPYDSASQRYDISNPTAPVYQGECGGGGGNATVLSGSIQYSVHRYGETLSARDLSGVPPAPCPGTLLGSVEIPELYHASDGLLGVALAGDYVYVTAGFLYPRHYSLLYVVDFSDPLAPVLVNTWGDPTGEELHLFQAVAVSDGRLYWAGDGQFDPLSRTLVILDIDDPATPTLIGEYSSAAKITEIEVVGTTVYLGDVREGLTILDCSDPANPSRVGNYFSPARLQQGALDGDKLYVTDKFYGVTVLDVSDPRSPSLTGKWETGDFTADRGRMENWGIAVRDDLAYLAAGRGGFQVLDVSDPTAPTLAGEFSPWPSHLQSRALALSPDEPIVHLGVHTFAGFVTAWVMNFDVSYLSNIVDVGSVYIGSNCPYTIVRRTDGIAYVARDTALVTVNLSDPESPALVDISAHPQAVDLALDEGPHESYVHAVAMTSASPEAAGLHILWVSPNDPVPALAGHYDDEVILETYAVATHPVHKDRVYIGLEPLSLRVIDVRMPWYPLLMGSAPCAGALIVDLIVDGTTVYAITDDWQSGGAGVLVYQVFYPGDLDDDGDVDLRDYSTLQRCFSGGAGLPPGRAGADCLIFDFDEDDDVDGADYAAFRLEATEPR